MLDSLKDLIFPKRCLGCGRWGEYLCPDCLNFIKPVEEPICPLCSQPSIGGLTHPFCHRSLGLDGLTSVFVYQGVIKKAVTKLKYQFVTDLAETILELFLSFIGEDRVFTHFLREKNVCLVPVPLHWTRENWRGFNQAKLLGERIAEKLDIDFMPDLLTRRKPTLPQSKLKKEKRQENVVGAFAFNDILPAPPFGGAGRLSSVAASSPPLEGRSIRRQENKEKYFNSRIRQFSNLLLFDDVWTTGATLKNCCQVLKRNGTKKVWGLTLAR